MTDTPTAYSMQYRSGTPTYSFFYHRECERCGEPARNFTELYNPRGKNLRTVYLCDSCQARLCAEIDLFLKGDGQ